MTKRQEIEVTLEKFMRDGQVLSIPNKGHSTLFPAKGANGNLLVTVNLAPEADRWIVNTDVHTRHYLPLSDAISGCRLKIDAATGPLTLTLE